MPIIAITDLGGSLNQGRAPSELASNEYTDIQNFYQFGAKLRRRGGMRRLTTSPFFERITGLGFYQPELLPPGGVDMIVAGPTRLGVFVGSSIATIPNQAGFVISSSDRLWMLFQYKNIEYGIREGIGLIRTDGTYVGPTGIDAPPTAPTIVDGAAGAIPAASFKAVYTYYNPITALESNPSPVSTVLAHAGSKKIDWSGITASPNVQVARRRLYRTLPDQSGEYFFVAEIADNATTTFIGDNVLTQDFGRAVSFSNGTPPGNLKFGAVFKERLFASDGIDLFHSEDGLIEAFDSTSIIPVFPDDGHFIRAIHAYGDRLVIGKTNMIHYLVGSDPSTFVLLTLSDRHGCVSHHSMQSAEGYLFWLGTDNVYRSDGNNVTGIASVKLRRILDELDTATARNATATVFPELGWYVLFFPPTGALGTGTQLIYNYRTDVWTTVPSVMSVQVVGNFFDADRVQQMYVSDASGHVYRFHDTTYGFDDTDADLGVLFAASFTSRVFAGEVATKSIVDRVSLLCQRYPETVILDILDPEDQFPNLPGAIVKEREVSLDYHTRWKLYNLSTRHTARTHLRFRLTYIGQSAVEIEGYALNLMPLGRPSMQAL